MFFQLDLRETFGRPWKVVDKKNRNSATSTPIPYRCKYFFEIESNTYLHVDWLALYPLEMSKVPIKTAAEPKSKTGLKKGRVARGHFSVRDSRDDFTRTRLIVRVLKGTHLLASDIMTQPPSSDPICFGWCGFPQWSSGNHTPKPAEMEKEWGGDELTEDGGRESNEPAWITEEPAEGTRSKATPPEGGGRSVDGLFRTTRVVPGTLDPVWDEEMEFDVGALLRADGQKRLWMQLQDEMAEQERLDKVQAGITEEEDVALQNPMKRGDPTPEDYKTLEIELVPEDTLRRLMQLSAFIYIRDADPAYLRAEGDAVPEDVTYDSLGRVMLDFGEIVDKARFANGSLLTNCLAYKVQKMPGMPSMPMGVDLGALSLGCSLVLGSDEAGLAIKKALTPEYIDKALDSKAFCSQLKKYKKGESLEIKPQIDLTGRRRSNSRSISPSRSRPGTAGQNGMRSSADNSARRPSTGGGSSIGAGARARQQMRTSLDLNRMDASVKQAMKAVQELQPWKTNKGAQRYDNPNEDDTIDVVVKKSPAKARGDESDAAAPAAGLDVLMASGPGRGDEAVPDFGPPPSAGDQDLPDAVSEPVVDPELTGKDSEKEAGKEEDKDAAMAVLDTIAEKMPSPIASPAKVAVTSQQQTPGKENVSPPASESKIPRGGGSSAIKALRPTEEGIPTELQKVLLELKQLTTDSMKQINTRMEQLEQRMASPQRGQYASPGRLGGGVGGPKKSAPPTEAGVQRKERKEKREDRNKNFKQFQEKSKQQKQQRIQLDEANGLPRGSSDGPIIELVHGSKLNNTISAARLGEPDEPPRGGSPARRNPGAGYGGEEDQNHSYAHSMHGHGGSNSKSLLDLGIPGGPPGGGDECLPPEMGTQSMPPQQQYHPPVGSSAPKGGYGQASQPLRLNAAPLPGKAPHFASPDWARVDVWLRAGDIVSAYCEVLDRGSPDDFGRLLAEGGIHPYALSASILNRVCDMVSLILMQGAGQYTEICLLFILAVLRDSRVAEKPSSVSVLLGRTKHALSEALHLLSSKANQLPSKQALLAGLLQTQLNRI